MGVRHRCCLVLLAQQRSAYQWSPGRLSVMRVRRVDEVAADGGVLIREQPPDRNDKRVPAGVAVGMAKLHPPVTYGYGRPSHATYRADPPFEQPERLTQDRPCVRRPVHDVTRYGGRSVRHRGHEHGRAQGRTVSGTRPRGRRRYRPETVPVAGLLLPVPACRSATIFRSVIGARATSGPAVDSGVGATASRSSSCHRVQSRHTVMTPTGVAR